MDLKYFVLSIILYSYIKDICNSESITFMATERPTIYWFNRKYLNNLTVSSRRLGRQDPKYYVEVFLETRLTVENNVQMDFYFYEFLTNRYKPSFVELHFKFCDMIKKDTIFGPAVKKALGNVTCPIPPGRYDLQNMTIPYVPKGFPFTKGRIYCNFSVIENKETNLAGSGSIDMEIKTIRIKNKT